MTNAVYAYTYIYHITSIMIGRAHKHILPWRQHTIIPPPPSERNIQDDADSTGFNPI
jgi:hypothetical protein